MGLLPPGGRWSKVAALCAISLAALSVFVIITKDPARARIALGDVFVFEYEAHAPLVPK